MHARMSFFEGPPDNADEGLRHLGERVLPMMQQHDGYEGFMAFNDRQSGKVIGVSFWESERAMQASEGLGERARTESAEAGGVAVTGIERYEVAFFEMSSQS